MGTQPDNQENDVKNRYKNTYDRKQNANDAIFAIKTYSMGTTHMRAEEEYV